MDVRFNKYLLLLLTMFAGSILMLFARWLEQSLVAILTIGYPLLVCFGYFLGQQAITKKVIATIVEYSGGISGVLLASFTLAFWMIPRWMDASAANLEIAILKYLCLIFLVGFPLGCSWSKTHFITRAVVKIEFLTMLFRLGWIYLISPDRLCNNYLLGEQVLLGKTFLAIALMLIVVFCVPLFIVTDDKQDVCDGGLLCGRC